MIFFDTETTGLIKNKVLPLNQQPRIIEIGAVKVLDNGKEEYFQQILNPGVKLEPIITKITGLADDDLKDKPRFIDILPDLQEFFTGESVLVAHNLEFDLWMLIFELRRAMAEHRFPYPRKHICTVELAKPHYAGKYMKLERLYEDFFGAYEQRHRALEDAQDLVKVYHELMVRG